MFNRPLRRALALLLCLTLLSTLALAEDADITVDPFELPVEEAGEFILAPDPAEDALPEGDVPTEVSPAEVQPAPEGEAQPQEPAEPAPEGESVPQTQTGPALMAFAETAAVASDTWQSVDLRRADGFTGPLAQVTGKLTLAGALIDGVPARQVSLLDFFALGPTGSIAISDDAQLSLSLSAFSFNKGSSKTLKLTWNGASLSAKKAKWTTSNAKIVKVSKSGKLTAKKKGVATVTVSYKGVKTACQVVVTDIKQVKSVKVKPSKLTLALYGGVQLSAAISPGDAADKTITWTSSNPAVASVDANGLVAGLAGGTATITATASNGKAGKCKVTVKEIKPKTVDFAQLYITLNPGATFATHVSMSPASVSNPQVSYATSDPAVATVDASGVITATGVGAATITVTAAANAKAVNTCKVCVVAPGSARMAGLVIGINPGHQIKTIKKKYPLAPGSSKKAYGVKTGACGKWTRVNEYETVLQIGLKLARILTEQGATVVITRTKNDVMLTNIDRAKMLNAAGVDVALQLHCNSSKFRDHEGCSGYIRTTGDWAAESRAMSKALTKAISAETGCVNLGVKINNNYMSLNWTTTPTVLLEMGYLSNKKEDKLLATDDYREKMARGICEGLCAYFGR